MKNIIISNEKENNSVQLTNQSTKLSSKRQFIKSGIKSTLSLLIILSMVFMFGCNNQNDTKTNNNQSDKELAKIGVSQFVEHMALDDSLNGFIMGLADEGFEDGKNIQLDIKNSQGDVPTAQSIANNFVRGKKDLIFAIATPSAQAAKNATADIPVVFTAVTDPTKAGLVNDVESPESNITGSSDFLDVSKTLDSIQKLLPKTKKIGILMNTSEINSQIQVDAFTKEASKRNIEVVEVGISSVNEINQGISVLSSKVDVIFTPTDNLIASSMTLIVNEAMKNNIPVVGAEEAHVVNGALFANSISYIDVGRSAGQIAGKILKGKKISDLPVVFPTETRVVINQQSMKSLSLNLPTDKNTEFIEAVTIKKQ